MNSTATIAFLGTGSMAGAILTGLLNSGADASAITATTRTEASAERLRNTSPGVSAVSIAQDPAANRRAAAKSDVVVIGVEPGQAPALLDEIAGSLRPGTLILSIVSGLTLADLEGHIPAGVSLIRAMPNTPARVGAGMTGLAMEEGTPHDALQTAVGLFETSGTVLVIPESQMDALSAVSGSGPAYFFYFVEQFTEAAERLGFSHEAARTLVETTFTGSARLLAETGSEPGSLRAAVTSPGGTTEQALAVLGRKQYEEGLKEALDAAMAHAARQR